jgi:hypothetical protein
VTCDMVIAEFYTCDRYEFVCSVRSKWSVVADFWEKRCWYNSVYSICCAFISSNTVMIYLLCVGEFPRGKSTVVCTWTWHEGQGGTCAEENWEHPAGQDGLQLLWLAGQLCLCQVQFRCTGFGTDCMNAQVMTHCMIWLCTE